jgi:hypothetical protein
MADKGKLEVSCDSRSRTFDKPFDSSAAAVSVDDFWLVHNVTSFFMSVLISIVQIQFAYMDPCIGMPFCIKMCRPTVVCHVTSYDVQSHVTKRLPHAVL